MSGERIVVPAGNLPNGTRIESFTLDRCPVTLGRLGALADRAAEGAVFDLRSGRFTLVVVTPRRPYGLDAPRSSDAHPATQVSALEAEHFCRGQGGRLPTAAEWEHAARNGRGDRSAYPWGDDPAPGGRPRANTWQGSFPSANTLADGHLFASPVEAFPASPLGFRDLVGNVWQWTASSPQPGQRELRGGSYLCDPHVCHGFRVDAHLQQAAEDERFAHVGFRCAYDVEVRR